VTPFPLAVLDALGLAFALGLAPSPSRVNTGSELCS
jgi:hypothetical protein